MKLSVHLTIALALLCLQLGCGDGEDARLPVSGLITLDGQPLADAKITMMPKDGRRVANAITNESGRFESATTFSSGDGALIGSHYVAITPKTPPPMPGDEISSPGVKPAMGAKYVAPIPAQYGKPKESGLEADVARGSDNDFSFELESK
jgi:hypothetical protein